MAPDTRPAQALRLAGLAARQHGMEDPVRPVRASFNHVFRAGDVVVPVAAPRRMSPARSRWRRARMRYWLGDPAAPMWTPL